MSGEAQIEALLEIIQSSARQAVAEYTKGGNDVPTIHSKTLHPIDFATDTIALKKAVRLLEGACQQLCASLAPPQHTIHNYVLSFDWACVGVAVHSKVADTLEKYPNGLHIDDLAKLVNLEKEKLARVLRLLATKGCFIEVKPNIFANNRISLVTVSSSDTGAISGMVTDSSPQGAVVLYETLTEPEYAANYDSGMSPMLNALKKKGFKGSYFDTLDSPEKRDRYHRAMNGTNYIRGTLSILHHYQWNELKTVCDVGASFGTFSRPLSKMYPHLKVVNQDLPNVLVQARDVWVKDAPEALKNNRVEFVPLNFLEEGPVQGLDLYYLRQIIHDWPDTKAITILKNVRKSMAPHSRLLIHEHVLLPATCDPGAVPPGVSIAPQPLLANFGNGNNSIYQQDLNMWIRHNGKERMLDDIIALGSAAGLRLEKVHDLAATAALEFRVTA